MTIGFSTEINGQPSRFPAKIWHGIFESVIMDSDALNEWEQLHQKYWYAHVEKFGRAWDALEAESMRPKLTTIRKDEADQWKEGNKIHMVIHNRSKDRFQFMPVLTVKAIQRIEINYWSGPEYPPIIDIDNRRFVLEDSDDLDVIEMLAWNDGFGSVKEFLAYFNENFTGKIIHWTNLKY